MLTWLRHDGASPRRTLCATLLVALVLGGLVASAGRRVVGDGPEYIALAQAVTGGGGSALTTAWHFWMYPALAAPLVAACRAAGLSATSGFALLNVALLVLAFWVAARRLGPQLAVLVVVGPIIWWADKAHTEAFTFSLLTIALALENSPWGLVAVGLAATQNPPVAILLPLLIIRGWLDRPRGERAAGDRASATAMWAGAIAGFLLACLPAAYYEATRGVLNPLVATGQQQVPTAREFLVVLLDPNLGLVFGDPLFVLALVAAVVIILRRSGARALLLAAWLPAAAAVVFLWTFAQVTNFNHGATPGMSRYALWLLPLGLPLLHRAFPRSDRRLSRALAVVTACSVLWSLAFFRPSLPEAVGRPSLVARVLWHRFPALDNPLPEIFAERNSGAETRALPVTEPGCAKVLLIGDGGQQGIWPLPCRPAEVPGECRRKDALCYANRSGDRYRFVPIQPRRYHAFVLANDTWPAGSEAFARRILEGDGWRDARIVRTGQAGAMVRAVHAARRGHSLQGANRLFVCVVQPRDGANLDLRVPVTLKGEFFDLREGRLLNTVDLPSLPGIQSHPVPAQDLVGLLAVPAPGVNR